MRGKVMVLSIALLFSLVVFAPQVHAESEEKILIVQFWSEFTEYTSDGGMQSDGRLTGDFTGPYFARIYYDAISGAVLHWHMRNYWQDESGNVVVISNETLIMDFSSYRFGEYGALPPQAHVMYRGEHARVMYHGQVIWTAEPYMGLIGSRSHAVGNLTIKYTAPHLWWFHLEGTMWIMPNK